MLRAVIFDFNGVLVNDEPIHLEMFQKALREEGISISEEDYYARYLGMDDRGCFKAVYRDKGRKLDESALEALIRRKADHYRKTIQKSIALFPGVKTLLSSLSFRFPLAIASGALRSEIDLILERTELKQFFNVIVSVEDVTEGKPDPQIFMTAVERLNRHAFHERPLLAAECLVIEDSKEGILGAHRAGIKCLAVTNSHLPEQLKGAEAIVRSLEEVTIPLLEKLFV